MSEDAVPYGNSDALTPQDLTPNAEEKKCTCGQPLSAPQEVVERVANAAFDENRKFQCEHCDKWWRVVRRDDPPAKIVDGAMTGPPPGSATLLWVEEV